MKVVPKCQVHQVMAVITRAVPFAKRSLTPEHRLLLAVINQGVVDLTDTNYRRSVIAWLHDDRFETICNYLQIGPEYIRSILRDAGYLPNQNPKK